VSAKLRVLSHLPLDLIARVPEAHPDVELVVIPEEGELDPGLRGDVLLTMTWDLPNTAQVLKRGIRWVHTYGTGVDRFPFEALGGAALTCSRGASAVPISEWALAVMLAFEKELPERWIHEPGEPWTVVRPLGGLHGRRLGIVGFGGIGQALADRALPFGMRIRALRRSPAGAAGEGGEGVEFARDLGELMAFADHLVLAAPATRETHHMIGRAALARARQGLHLVNIARGSLVDQDALREALDADRIARASLDTVTPEPLPAGHWLYTHPKVRLSPHISWSGPGSFDALINPFIENLRRFKAGEKLIHQVNTALGY